MFGKFPSAALTINPSLTSHTLQSQEKEGLVTMRTSCSRGMQKTSRVTVNRAGSAICARAASKALLSNKFKISNLIGRVRISGARTTRCTHSHQTLFLLRLKGVASETK